MTQNESADVWSALLAFQADPPELKRDGQANTGAFSYSYVKFDHALPVVLAKLNALGLVVSQPPRDGGLWTILHHVPSNTEIVGDMPYPDADPQGLGSATTYFRRYCLFSMLGLVPDEDDDGAAAQGTRSRRSSSGAGGDPSEKQRKFVGDLRREVKDLMGEKDGGLAIRAAFEATGAIEGLTRDNVGPLIDMLIEVRDEAKKNKKERDLSSPTTTVELPPDEEPLGVAYDPGDDIPFHHIDMFDRTFGGQHWHHPLTCIWRIA